MQKIHFEIIDSTNTYGKSILRSGNFQCPTLITATRQTGGRGRNNRSFFSEGGLYMSLLLDSHNPTFPITCAAAVAVKQCIFEVYGIDLSIKWVNDLFYNHKKVCGILTEAVTDENSILKGFVCGIGLNTQNTVLPDPLKEIATTLPVPKEGLAEKIAEKILTFYRSDYPVMPLYKEGLLLNLKVNAYQNDAFLFSGTAVDINENGNLLVETEDGLQTLTSGEISIKLS
ncbi:MAG: biotin--[Clostridia bacterium]|nr:biotin--[acetyl-CoA-carboxylase] ligase [Clostridia bacterium]